MKLSTNPNNCFLVNLWLVSDLIYFSLLDLLVDTDGFIQTLAKALAKKFFPPRNFFDSSCFFLVNLWLVSDVIYFSLLDLLVDHKQVLQMVLFQTLAKALTKKFFCYDQIITTDALKIVSFCTVCKNAVHTECINKWISAGNKTCIEKLLFSLASV